MCCIHTKNSHTNSRDRFIDCRVISGIDMVAGAAAVVMAGTFTAFTAAAAIGASTKPLYRSMLD